MPRGLNGRWGLIGPEHLEDACKRAGIRPEELEGMVVCLNTGMHRQFDDSKRILPLFLRNRGGSGQMVCGA